MKLGHLITNPPHAAVMNDVVTQAATNPLPVSVPPDTHMFVRDGPLGNINHGNQLSGVATPNLPTDFNTVFNTVRPVVSSLQPDSQAGLSDMSSSLPMTGRSTSNPTPTTGRGMQGFNGLNSPGAESLSALISGPSRNMNMSMDRNSIPQFPMSSMHRDERDRLRAGAMSSLASPNSINRPSSQRGVGEIGAASGLFMLSQSHGDHSERPEGSNVYPAAADMDKRNLSRNMGTQILPKPETPSLKRKVSSSHLQENFDESNPNLLGSNRSKNRSFRGLDDDESESVDSKRKNFLERNRQAAYKCRQRKKAWLASLQAKVEYLQSDNESLQNTIEALRSEVMFLKSQLMQHVPGALENEDKDTHEEVPRSLPSDFTPLNVPISNGFVNYSSQPSTSNLLMPSMSTMNQISGSSNAIGSQGMDQSMQELTQNNMSNYNESDIPRLTHIPATQQLMQAYAPASHPFAANRGGE